MWGGRVHEFHGSSLGLGSWIFRHSSMLSFEQGSIPLGCVLPTCQPYMFWWPPLSVSISQRGGYPPQVSCPRGGYPLLDIPTPRHIHPWTYLSPLWDTYFLNRMTDTFLQIQYFNTIQWTCWTHSRKYIYFKEGGSILLSLGEMGKQGHKNVQKLINLD